MVRSIFTDLFSQPLLSLQPSPTPGPNRHRYCFSYTTRFLWCAQVTDEYSDSSSEEQKSQSGASDLVLDSEKTSDSGVLTNNSGGSTPVNVIPVQLSHTAAPFHMECPQPYEILHGAPFLLHHHHHHLPAAEHHQMAAYYQPIPQYAAEQLAPIGYQVIPEEQAADVADDGDDDDDDEHRLQDVEPVAGYSAENSDSGISSPNSEVMVKGGSSAGVDNKHEKPQSGGAGSVANAPGTGTGGPAAVTTTGTGTGTAKKSRNKKNKGRDKGSESNKATMKLQGNKTADQQQKNGHHHHESHAPTVGSKKSSKIAKEPAIIKKLNAAKKAKNGGGGGKSEADKPETGKSPPPPPLVRSDGNDDDEDDDERSGADLASADDGGLSEEIIQLSIGPVDAEWTQEEVFCSLECTPRSTTTDHVKFQFAKTQSVDSCESVEEETFATAVNTGNSDTENETVLRQDEPADKLLQQDASSCCSVSCEGAAAAASVSSSAAAPGPITEAVTKWLNDQGGLMLAPCLDDSSSCTDEGELSEYDDFEEHPSVAAAATASPKNVQGNPYPALSRNEAGSRVAGTSSHDQRQTGGLVSSGICCLTQ